MCIYLILLEIRSNNVSAIFDTLYETFCGNWQFILFSGRFHFDISSDLARFSYNSNDSLS